MCGPVKRKETKQERWGYRKVRHREINGKEDKEMTDESNHE